MRTAHNDPELMEETRRVMERQLRQLVTLVDDLLDVSRVSHGKLKLRMCAVSLSDVIASAVEAAKPVIDAAGHNLVVQLPDQPLTLHADPYRLAQVLSNLLDNAAKYTPKKGSIWLTVERRGSEVEVSIKDTGIGIPADMLTEIFDLFTRSKCAESTHSGLGIGLSLVKSIVQMHHGRVEATSDGSGRGTTFHVVLPLTEEQVAIATPPVNVSVADGVSQHRVMVVDDNVAAANLLSILVRQMGNEVRVAYDGQQAIEVADDFRPDIVFMDLGMPTLDGYGAARHIRQQSWGRDMLLIALTGWGQEKDRERVRETGFDRHLVKPADPVDVRRLLSEIKRPIG